MTQGMRSAPAPRALRIWRAWWLWLAVAILATAPVTRAGPPPAGAGAPGILSSATIAVTPQPASLRIGERTVVEVGATGLPPLTGLRLQLRFDPSRLRVVYAAPGAPVARGELLTPAFAEQENSADGGVVTYSAFSATPSAGDGVLARITFEALATGDTSITLLAEGTTLVSPDGLSIEYTATGGTLVIQPSLRCSNCVTNGGFEAATTAPWATEGLAQRYTEMARTGAACAWLGGHNYALRPADTLSQAVTLGATPQLGRLSYWVYIQSEKGATVGDRLTVQLQDGAGNVLVSHTWTNLDAEAVWQESPTAELDLAPYAGQTLHLTFHATGDGDAVTNFFVDDVSLTACGESDQPALPWRAYLPLVLSH